MTDRDWVPAAVVVAVALLLAGPLLMWVGMLGVGMMRGGMWGGGMWGAGPATPGWLWVLGVLLPLGLVVAVLALGVLAVRALSRGRNESDPALEELRHAYARGDLSDEEYERRRQRLREGDAGSGN